MNAQFSSCGKWERLDIKHIDRFVSIRSSSISHPWSARSLTYNSIGTALTYAICPSILLTYLYLVHRPPGYTCMLSMVRAHITYAWLAQVFIQIKDIRFWSVINNYLQESNSNRLANLTWQKLRFANSPIVLPSTIKTPLQSFGKSHLPKPKEVDPT